MKYFFLFIFLTSNGKTIYADMPGQKDWKPIQSYSECKKEAKNIEERMRPGIQSCKLFADLTVTCKRYTGKTKKRR